MITPQEIELFAGGFGSTLILYFLARMLFGFGLGSKGKLAREQERRRCEDEERNRLQRLREEQNRLRCERERKVETIRHQGGLLSQEFLNKPDMPDSELNVLYLAASEQEIKFDLVTDHKLEIVPYGTNNMEYVQVRDASELPYVMEDQTQMSDDLFYHAFASGNLVRPEYRDMQERNKLLYILLDISPSMRSGKMPDGSSRSVWARGVVASLLVEAMEDRAVYLLKYFWKKVSNTKRATNPKEAGTLLAEIVHNDYCEASTDIGNALKAAVTEIRSRSEEDVRMNHVLLVTDAEDTEGLTRDAVVKLLGEDIFLHVVQIGIPSKPEDALAPYLLAQY